MFQVNEIKKWAKSHGFSVKKQEENYIWFEEKNKDIVSSPMTIDEIAKEIFNKITNNKFVEHQKAYKEKEI